MDAYGDSRIMETVALRHDERLPIVVLHDDGTYSRLTVEWDSFVGAPVIKVTSDKNKKMPLMAVVNGERVLPPIPAAAVSGEAQKP